MDEGLWSQIRRMYFVEHFSQREITSKLGIDRSTVKRALSSKSCPQKSVGKRASKLDPYKERIKAIISKYPHLSAVRILEEIRKDGYSGRMTILKEYLSSIRGARREAFLRIETLPGELAQVDWADCGKIMVEGIWRRLSCFVMVLSYSRMMYLEFTLSQRIEDFIQAHINAFNFFGGVTKKILYDSLKAVVLWRMEGKIGFNRRFMDFAGVYLFAPRLCRLYRGSDKGKVESGIKYVKGNFLAGRTFKDFGDLKRQAIHWRDEIANVRNHGTTHQRPIDRFCEEKDKLMELPGKPYEVVTTVALKSSSDCRVKFDTNIYSVPPRYAMKVVTLKATKDKVFIYYKDKLIAKHKRSWGKYKVIEDPRHYKHLLQMKKKAIASKIKDEFIALGKEAKEYFDGLQEKDCVLPKELAQILKLRHLYGVTEILQAISEALKYKAFGASYIENIVVANRTKRGEPLIHGEVSLPENLAEEQVEEKHPSIYDILLEDEDEES